jgi:general secretion pathway protein M
MRLLPESERSQRFLALLLLLGTVIVGYFLLIHWWLVAPYLDMRDQYYDLKDQQFKFAELIQSRPLIEKQLKDIAGLEKENQAFLNDSDAASAFSDISERVKRAVEDYRDPNGRCTINGIAPANNHTSEVYLRVSATVSMNCQGETLDKVIYVLESSNPYLFVDRLVLFRQQVMAAPGRKAPPNTLVNAQFLVSGFLRQSGNAKGVK